MYLLSKNKRFINNILRIGLWALLILSTPVAVGQQNVPSDLEIVAVNAMAQAGGVDLDVYFTARNSQRRPIDARSAIEPVVIQLPDVAEEPFEAIISKPETPIFITLVIDASGSMRQAIAEVKRAAERAIDRAPENAHFRIVQFDDRATPRTTGFTDDRSFVKNAIQQITVDDGGTCIYNTLYDEINILKQNTPNAQDRRAIILFTDGKDQRNVTSDDPCSFRSLDEVLSSAKAQGGRTPIHTIGMSASNADDNIDRQELERIASQTLAFSAIGSADQLDGLFSTIMQDLNSQWVARAKVLAAQGDNVGLLRLDDHNVTESFSFSSPREYSEKIPFRINEPQWHSYEENDNTYVIPLLISGGQEGMQITYVVTKNGQLVGGKTLTWDPSINQIVIPEAEIKDGFEIEAEYLVQFQAADPTGVQLLNDDEEATLTEYLFKHEVNATSVAFVIDGIDRPDYRAGLLTLHLSVSNPELIQSYQVEIKDGDTGEFIDRGEIYPFSTSTISTTLPIQIQDATESKQYPISVILYDFNGDAIVGAYDDFRPLPQEPCGLFCIIYRSLANNLLIVILILIIIAMITYYVWSQRQQQIAPVRSIPVPSHRHTVMQSRATPVANNAVRKPVPVSGNNWEDEFDNFDEDGVVVKLTVMKTRKTEMIRRYPYIIGRSSTAHYKITGDRSVSREHLRLDNKNGTISVTTLSSSGAIIGGDVYEKGDKFILKNESIVCVLGSTLEIRLEPLR